MFTGFFALYAREVKRFQKLLLDTVFSPIMSLVLYLAVFGIVARGQTIGSVPYVAFVYTGLLGMVMVNSSFSNPSFALIIAKNLGSIVDVQLAPLRPWQVGLAYVGAALTRGVVTVVFTAVLTAWAVAGISLQHPFFLLAAFILTGLEFGLFGVIFGMRAKNFEALTFITTFVLQPMIFLAGVFYPIAHLPAPWSTISLFNPLHHTINLIRYGFVGYSDFSVVGSLGVVAVLCAILFFVMHFQVRKSLRF